MNSDHVDLGLAQYSDWAFTTSTLVLLAAMLLLAVELSYSCLLYTSDAADE